jgi:hypothetical protein
MPPEISRVHADKVIVYAGDPELLPISTDSFKLLEPDIVFDAGE